jgi:hypothetical protein
MANVSCAERTVGRERQAVAVAVAVAIFLAAYCTALTMF